MSQARQKGPREYVEPEVLAVERFGSTEGLILVHGTKIELAEHYAREHELNFKDPDVVATCTLKAWSRFREFALLQAVEEAVYEFAEANGESYEKALLAITTQGSQKLALQEITRLHGQAKSLTRELRSFKRQV